MDDFVYVVKSGKGESYKEIAAVLPNELPKLIAGKDLTLNEATNVCLAVLRWEHKYHEGFVASALHHLDDSAIRYGECHTNVSRKMRIEQKPVKQTNLGL